MDFTSVKKAVEVQYTTKTARGPESLKCLLSDPSQKSVTICALRHHGGDGWETQLPPLGLREQKWKFLKRRNFKRWPKGLRPRPTIVSEVGHGGAEDLKLRLTAASGKTIAAGPESAAGTHATCRYREPAEARQEAGRKEQALLSPPGFQSPSIVPSSRAQHEGSIPAPRSQHRHLGSRFGA